MTINNIARNQMSNAMMRLSSGQRINSAADDAAGLAIVENMTAQVRGLDQGIRNTADMQALVQTAEGGLDQVGNSLQRIRELSVQGLNGINTPEQRAMIRGEIDQLTQGIEAMVSGVQFNTMNLLDGTVQGANTASGADGTGAQVSINDMSAIAQAVANINQGEFDLNVIDSALDMVAEERANLGALHNRFDYTANANSISSLNLVDARSRIADADIAAEMMNLQQDLVLNEMQIMLQARQQEDADENNQRIMTTGI
ncbi:MAG: flagellin [Defluviitaleaceae bacterium]|nr:flagellin [Defluviitaleaceae bacterium]